MKGHSEGGHSKSLFVGSFEEVINWGYLEGFIYGYIIKRVILRGLSRGHSWVVGCKFCYMEVKYLSASRQASETENVIWEKKVE